MTSFSVKSNISKQGRNISMGLYYKTFYDHNFHNKLVFVLEKPFQPSLMFVGEAKSLP
jgi:hypothetical protein